MNQRNISTIFFKIHSSKISSLSNASFKKIKSQSITINSTKLKRDLQITLGSLG
jgi:CRISPR/Cas system type I-B associated protein Csh2 (Cas7 group RAMP superfamily)